MGGKPMSVERAIALLILVLVIILLVFAILQFAT